MTGDPPRPPSGMVASSDPYLLRELLWCGPCNVWMTATRAAGDRRRRTYKCAMGCRTAALLAEDVELKVWEACRQRAATNAIQPAYQKSVLEMLLTRVIVGANTDDLTFIWRN
ncbi:zinc ribbon domain-containing protein [Plantactinospora sp. DSM 117369]